MIRGLIFDFDGLILDTEMPVYTSWVELFQSYGEVLPFDDWAKIIGTSDIEHFDPFNVLEEKSGFKLDRDVLAPKRHEREMVLCLKEPILPGVVEIIKGAHKRGLKLGIASSSSREWVAGHLTRLGLIDYFPVIHTSDDVEKTKPDPALYTLALESLGLNPEEAVVFEDSPNGVTSAKALGIFVVAVPNTLTRNLKLDHADLILESLAGVNLEDVLVQVGNDTKD